ncbi:hypothetical protein KUV65_03145 [Maritalea mobilis]|uniref:hypothetical protein n=1 Tax=Maritalea mobilis TaxID=483324 RepID=UPI001C982AA4|nr:hypothetical protein [Maritalea mobilis]MBY6200345.1 hypothetical protein [Maritalea mobilis]
MTRLFLAAALSALSVASVSAQAPGQEITCDLSVICLGVAPCQDWEQTITVVAPEDEAGDWTVDWAGERRAGYTLVADIPAPEGSLRPARIRTLVHAADDTQAVQIVTLSDIGHIAVTLHQPHLTPPSVTAGGVCPALIPEGADQ